MVISPVLPIDSKVLLGHNQEIFHRLESALQATPPCQLWLAACDDLPLQRQLAATLESELQLQGAIASTQLIFNAENPDLVQQMQVWTASGSGALPLLQILGIEQLTYRSSDQQYQFLRSLKGLQTAWQALGCNLLIWLPRPWLKKVKRTVPALCQTVFEFMGEPTPLSTVEAHQSYRAAFSSMRQWQLLSHESEATAAPTESLQPSSGQSVQPPSESSAAAAVLMPVEGSLSNAASTDQDSAPDVPTFSETLWHQLEADLTQLESAPASLLSPPPEADEPPQPERAPATTTPEAGSAHKSDAAIAHRDPAETDVKPVPPVASDAATTSAAPPAPPSDELERQSAAQPADTTPAVATESDAMWSLAYEMRDRVQAGDQSSKTLKATIQQYKRLLATYPQSDRRTEVLNDLGSLYWLVAQQTQDHKTYQQCLIHSCKLYESAIKPVSTGTGAEVLTRLHSNLGSVYSLISTFQDPPQYLAKAVRTFHRALQNTPAEAAPLEYGMLQTHLGTAYWGLAQHSQEANHLHQAIAAYQQAIQHAQPKQMPEAYAQLSNNLGIALWSLSRHERPAFLLGQAVVAYRSALAYRTLDTDPAGCAATQNNLGTAYWDMGGHCTERSPEQKQAWQQAIVAYETAILAAEQLPPEALGFDPWATHHSVGVVYDQLAIALVPDAGAQYPHLNNAVRHYVKAFNGWQATHPEMAQTAFQAIVRNLHLQAQYLGIEAQQRSLSQVPAELLPDLWRKL